ncbi:hypothetical protein B0H12DRAFT_984065, partial [Mycena haematopus]
TVHDMPVQGGKDAPKKFRGKYTEVQTFIDHYERLLNKCRIRNEQEKCTHILKYCSIDTQYVIQTLEGYSPPRWSRLKREILKHFDADRMYQKYKPADVERFAARRCHKPCYSLTNWRKYFIKYNTIAGGPLTKGYLSREDYNAYFFIGIHRPLRQILENRILQANPFRGDAAQYTVAEINAAAEWHFRRNKYETLMVRAADWGEEPVEENSEEDSTSDSTGSDASDSDYEEFRLKRKQRAKKKREERKKKKPTPKKNSSNKETQRFQGNEEEVASLIRQLGAMRLDDPEYAPIYYKVMVLDQSGLAAKCVKVPEINRGPVYRAEPSAFRSDQTSGRQTAGRDGATTGPATYPNNIPLGMSPPANGEQPGCYGCLGPGHRISDCPKIADLVSRKVVVYDEQTRKLVMANGQWIRRQNGESLAQAAERISGATAPRVMFVSSKEDYERRDAIDSPQVQAAERTEASTRKARKQVFDGTVSDKSLENPKKTAIRPSTPIPPPNVSEIRPVDARRVRFAPEEDSDMEDVSKSEKTSKKVSGKQTSSEAESQKEKEEKNKPIGRQSELSNTVSRQRVMDRILDVQIPMSLRELMVTSKELRTEFQDLIKVKNVRAVLMGSSRSHPALTNLGWPRTDGILIKIEMQTSGNTVCAIIDTGSQLNVVRSDIAAKKIQQAVDMSQITNMNDANGGQGQLQGWIKDVHFHCGDARTTTDLWVSQNAPFALLLGRPWQRGNLVSIDERDEGTYLIF